MKRSAGIITYKIEDNDIKVLLCHFGGPFWEGIDEGGWSFSKGEVCTNENILAAARREFTEETGLVVNGFVKYLASKKVSNKKLVIMFYKNLDLDISHCTSNTFKMEYPRGSGKIESFPEMDKYEWMSIDKAREKIIKNQLFFLDRLEEVISKGEIL